MAFEITIPRLGWSMEEGTFVRWLKRDGDRVQPGEAVSWLPPQARRYTLRVVDDLGRADARDLWVEEAP